MGGSGAQPYGNMDLVVKKGSVWFLGGSYSRVKGEQRGDTLLFRSSNDDLQQQGHSTIAREQRVPRGSNMLHVSAQRERRYIFEEAVVFILFVFERSCNFNIYIYIF